MDETYKKFIMRAGVLNQGGSLKMSENGEAIGAYTQQIKLYNNPDQ